MANEVMNRQVGDDVPKVDGAVAVGEDLRFQQRWWKFERVVWSIFVLILLADISGILGRGPLAKAERKSADGNLTVRYERVQRENTNSMLTVLPGSGAVQGGKFDLFVSDALLRKLGTQRVIPQPVASAVGNGGVTYTFAATTLPITVGMELKPTAIGMQHFVLAVPGGQRVQAETFVLP